MTESPERKYLVPITIGDNLFMTSFVNVTYPQCKCFEVDEQEANEWKSGFKTYTSLMHERDRLDFEEKLKELNYNPSFKCMTCHNVWMKDVGNQVKIAGPRWSRLFVFFLDLFAFSNWTTYTQDEVDVEAERYSIIPENKMFPLDSDEDLAEDIKIFLNAHCVLGQDEIMTYQSWLDDREWANHGTAKDVEQEMGSLQKDIVRDKAALAYAMTEDDLYIPDVLENKVFPKRDRKKRIIVVGPTTEYIPGSYCNYVVINTLQSNFFKVSNTKNAPNVVETIRSQLVGGALNLPIDQSAFDLNQRKAAIVAVREWIVDKVIQRTGENRLAVLLTDREEIITGSGLKVPLQWNNGLLSGKWYTSVAGSLLNAYEVYRANNRTWFGIHRPTLHQGDDTQMAVRDEMVADTIMKNAAKLNIPINPTKNFVDRYRTDYLHRMYLMGPARVQFGDRNMIAEMQILSYPARSLTSWLWGDQDQTDLSTTAARQSTRVSKVLDRMHAIVTRLNNDSSEVLVKQSKLTEMEWNYARTPSAFGGLGATHFGRPSAMYKAVSGGGNKFLHLVEGFGGYNDVILKTEKFYNTRFEYGKVMQLVESTLKFKKLDKNVLANFRKQFFDLQPVDKSVVEIVLTKDVVFTRNIVHAQLNLPEQPYLSSKPPWGAAVVLLIGQERLWDGASLQMKSRLQRTGRYVVKLWETGGISISKRYSRQMNAEQLSLLAANRTQQLLLYLVNHRGKDITPRIMTRLKWDLERHLEQELDSTTKLFATY